MYPGIILMERCIFGVLNMPVRRSSEGMTGNVSKDIYFVSSGCVRKQKNEMAGTGNFTSRDTALVNHAGKHCVYHGISDVRYSWYL